MTTIAGIGDGCGRGRGRRRRPARRAPGRGRASGSRPVTGNPARARLAAIAAPIVPRPRKATRPRSGDGSPVMTAASRRAAGRAGRPAASASDAVGVAASASASRRFGRAASRRRRRPAAPCRQSAAVRVRRRAAIRRRGVGRSAASGDEERRDAPPITAIRMMIASRLPSPSSGRIRRRRGARRRASGRASALGAGVETSVTTTWTAVFGLPLVMTGTPAALRHVASVVADLGGHDVVLGRLDVGERIRDGEGDRQTLVDRPDVDAERGARRRVDQDGHRVGGRRWLRCRPPVIWPVTAPFRTSGR